MNPWLLLGGVVALIAAFAGGHFEGVHTGTRDERASWQKVAAKAEADATVLAAERQGRKDDADAAAAVRSTLLAAVAQRGRDTVKEYYRANPLADRPCLAVDRVRGIAAADAAAQAAAQASGGGDGAVRGARPPA